jgi:hypothetical protein
MKKSFVDVKMNVLMHWRSLILLTRSIDLLSLLFQVRKKRRRFLSLSLAQVDVGMVTGRQTTAGSKASSFCLAQDLSGPSAKPAMTFLGASTNSNNTKIVGAT